MEMTWADLPVLFPGVTHSARWLPLIQQHEELVRAAAERVRVTAVPAGEAVRRHYAESLELLRIVRERSVGERWVDVGSGGGFPGLVIAAVDPTIEMHLVEPLQKRARLLEEMAAAMGLANVTVRAARGEEAGRGPLRDACDVVVARAVAELREVLEYTAPLAVPGGLVALPKGSGFEGELRAAGNALRELCCELSEVAPMRPEVSETLSVALFRKLSATPARYPRRPGVPGKRPL